MKTKFFLALALAGASIASAKSYDISISNPSMFGTTQVESGQYKLSLDGSKVTLINSDTRKSFEADGKVQNAPKKFSETTVQSKQVAGKNVIDKIQIAGTVTEIDFNQ
jgi:hypothetical protein